MVEWGIALSIPVVIALFKKEPRWEQIWIFFCSVYLGTFTALAILPWTISMLKKTLSSENPYILLIALFAVMVLISAGLWQFLVMLLPKGNELVFLETPGGFPQRILLFCGCALIMGVLMVSLSALPLMNRIPYISNFNFREVGSQIMLSMLPTDSVASRQRARFILTNYPNHLSHCSAQKIPVKEIVPAGRRRQESTFDRSDTWIQSPFDIMLKAKKRAQELQQRRDREMQ